MGTKSDIDVAVLEYFFLLVERVDEEYTFREILSVTTVFLRLLLLLRDENPKILSNIFIFVSSATADASTCSSLLTISLPGICILALLSNILSNVLIVSYYEFNRRVGIAAGNTEGHELLLNYFNAV